MRRYLLGFAFILSSAASASAYAQALDTQVDVVKTYHACTTVEPAANEVYVYTNGNFGGTCAALYGGFYPNSGTGTGGFGLPNDSISSLKVGSSVRARLFADGIYGGSWFWFGGFGDYAVMPSGWNDVTSSIRVESNDRSTTCNDLQPGEFALFRDANFGSDCVVLHYSRYYVTPSDMGIANDSVSSVYGGPQAPAVCPDGTAGIYYVVLYSDATFGGNRFNVFSGTSNSYLSSFNDVTSSIFTVAYCPN
jgi:hypothetical protein